MGFTFSHPALILPFRYLPDKYYSLSGLVIGSIAPDFEYFIRPDNDSTFSHTIPGLFGFNLPISILTISFFHLVIRNRLLVNLPFFVKSRLLSIHLVNWLPYLKKNWILVIISILMGSATHLLWDSFTSINGHFVKSNPHLLMKTDLLGIEIFNYKIIKHASSVLGGMVLIMLLFKLPKVKFTAPADKHFWMILFLIFFLCFLLQYILITHAISYNSIIKKSISSGLFALIITSLYYKAKTQSVI